MTHSPTRWHETDASSIFGTKMRCVIYQAKWRSSVVARRKCDRVSARLPKRIADDRRFTTGPAPPGIRYASRVSVSSVLSDFSAAASMSVCFGAQPSRCSCPRSRSTRTRSASQDLPGCSNEPSERRNRPLWAWYPLLLGSGTPQGTKMDTQIIGKFRSVAGGKSIGREIARLCAVRALASAI